MDIDNPPALYDDNNYSNPMRLFAFVINKDSAPVLKLLLDRGLSADSVRGMWEYAFDDFEFECADPLDDSWNDSYI
jgi:hypothetical protein